MISPASAASSIRASCLSASYRLERASRDSLARSVVISPHIAESEFAWARLVAGESNDDRHRHERDSIARRLRWHATYDRRAVCGVT
jgi:hypothetical protein